MQQLDEWSRELLEWGGPDRVPRFRKDPFAHGGSPKRHKIRVRLTAPQEEFVFSDARFPLFCGGYGAGKSEALVTRILMLKLAYPKLDVGYFAPTFDLVRLIAWPRFIAKLDEWGIPYKANKADRVIYIKRAGAIICRTMDNPDSIVGFEISDAAVDELDTLKEEHAEAAWNKIIARCRQRKQDGKRNTAAVGTTPEGFRFAYRRWALDIKPGYVLIRAPSSSNPLLPKDYIQSLTDTYPAHVLAAYLNGEFVNMTSGAVHPDFDRRLNATDAVLQPGEAVHVGMDFNVLKMAAVIFVIRGGLPYAVDEITDGRDTPSMAKLLVERFKDKGHHVTVYPDASGQNTSSKSASESDLTILKQHHLAVVVNSKNPEVKDRVNSVNGMILNGAGERRLKVNTAKCPKFTAALEQQVYDKHGKPDKSGGHDHIIDAGGYFVVKKWPVSGLAVWESLAK